MTHSRSALRSCKREKSECNFEVFESLATADKTYIEILRRAWNSGTFFFFLSSYKNNVVAY